VKYILITIFIVTITYAKKDFYYSYIDNNKEQFSQSTKDKIRNENSKIIYINKLLKDNQIDDAYKQIVLLRGQNKQDVLKSSIELLYAKILYNKRAKKHSVKADKILLKAINEGIINQNDLLEALILMVDINLKINKARVARKYAKNIKETFKDPLSLAYSDISYAKINIKKRRYKRAIKTLYNILIKTNDLKIATIVSDELYDAYILDKQNKKAYDLTVKVLNKNIDYYANNPTIAMIKINKLKKAKMPHLAIRILKALLKNSKKQKQINEFKYILANTYMSINSKELTYLLKAKELYKDLIRQRKDNPYKKLAKMYLDEILMREGILTPQIVASKYPMSEVMYHRTLLQELLNNAQEKKYDLINKLKNVYLKIPDITAKRFGYKDLKEIFDDINLKMINEYLQEGQCNKFDEVIKTMPTTTIKRILENNTTTDQMFNCMLEYPNKKTFKIANKVFLDSNDASVYLNLEKIAIKLDLIDDALDISKRIDGLKNEKIKSQEFLYRFLIYAKQNNTYSMDKFFTYTQKHKYFIFQNQDKPMIIDFYYQYYLYLIKNKNEDEANKILTKLYYKQNEMDAHIYSPFVEMQIASNYILDDDYENGLKYYKEALKNPRKIGDNELVQIYYEMAKIYKKLNKENRYKDSVNKCKAVKNAKSLYKSMCEKL
jgi:tetratricopeptide (TPR) repeat protein